MNTNNHIDILDETLKILFLESGKAEDVQAQKEMAMILSNENPIEMPDSMHHKLMNQLNSVLVQLSLGQLIKDAIQKNNIDKSLLGEQIGLPLPVLKELEEDTVFTNNVPILLLRKLLAGLNISFKTAEQAIRRTFDLLQSRTTSAASFSGITPAFKKGGFSSRESYIRNMPKNSGKELFQNEEALNRYLNRLHELMNE